MRGKDTVYRVKYQAKFEDAEGAEWLEMETTVMHDRDAMAAVERVVANTYDDTRGGVCKAFRLISVVPVLDVDLI